MSDRNGIFAGEDPIALLRNWLSEATESELRDANAMTLATVDSDGVPNARTVLLKGIEDDALVFYTNYESRKAQELESAGSAALLLYWKSLGRQIRVRGTVSRVDDVTSDDYYKSRPLQSRIGAWASAQSQPLTSRQELVSKVEQLTADLGQDPPRPPNWGGYRLKPSEFEFWCEGDFRLHDRFSWVCAENDATWKVRRLSP